MPIRNHDPMAKANGKSSLVSGVLCGSWYRPPHVETPLRESHSSPHRPVRNRPTRRFRRLTQCYSTRNLRIALRSRHSNPLETHPVRIQSARKKVTRRPLLTLHSAPQSTHQNAPSAPPWSLAHYQSPFSMSPPRTPEETPSQRSSTYKDSQTHT